MIYQIIGFLCPGLPDKAVRKQKALLSRLSETSEGDAGMRRLPRLSSSFTAVLIYEVTVTCMIGKNSTFVIMKFVFLIASFIAFFFTILLFQKKPGALHDKILTFWLIYLGSFIGVYALYSYELFTRFQLLSISLISLLMLYGPFLYLYIKILVSDESLFSWKDVGHLVPFVFFNMYIFISSFNPDISQRLDIDKVAPGNNTPLLFSISLILTAFSGTVYFLLTFRLFKRLDINIFNNFPNPANIDLY